MPCSRSQVIPFVFATLLLCVSTVAQQAPPSADTFVSSSAPTTNYGSSIILVVGSGTSAYLKFNLSGVPPGGSVSKATLRLFVDAVAAGGQFDVYNLPGSPNWSESTLKYSTPPPALGSSATGGHPITVSNSSFNTFLLIDITATVRGWLTTPSSNNGVALALVGTAGSFSFDSKESFLTAHQPELEIVLTGPAGAQGATGATGATGPAGPVGPVGATGAKGDAGATGAIGATGPKGDAGATGATGATGPQGVAGPTGPVGATGPAGATGATGTMGPAGSPGSAGPIGPAGPQGIAGLNARGPWNGSSTYVLNDVTSDQGQTYRCANSGATGGNAFNFSFASSLGSGNGTFVTNPQSGGSYLVTAITGGTMNGVPITLLSPNTYGSSDNLITATFPYLDTVGLEFSTDGQPENFLAFNGSPFICVPGSGNCVANKATPLNLTLTNVTACSLEPGASNVLPGGEWELLAASGAAGAPGTPGLPGSAGPQGPTGATGSAGPQGPPGIGMTGPAGAQGLQGVPGPQGPAGTSGGDPNSRMIFPSFYPGNLTGTWVGGQFTLDQAITVLRIAAVAKTPTGATCPAAVFRLTNSTKGQDLVLTPGQNWSDTGAMVMTFNAGDALQASLRTGSTCASNTGADANLLVEYKMQAAGDTDACSGASCNGFCTSFSSDPSNCGTCGTACASGISCAGGTCGSGGGSCNPPQTLCGSTCTSLVTDPNNCGTCGTICAPGSSCTNGTCQTTPSGCFSGDTLCSGKCSNLSEDSHNCGACGNACNPSTQTCSGGACLTTLTCGSASTRCAGGCVDLITDPRNCGTCGNLCNSGQSCVNGSCKSAASCTDGIKNGNETDVDCGGGTCAACGTNKACVVNTDCQSNSCVGNVCQAAACPSGQTLCGSTCVNTSSDITNCGGCGQVCSANNIAPACSGGFCNGSCNPGFADCNGNKASDGCETNLNSVLSCGGCGLVCSTPNGTPACANSACRVGSCNAGFGDCNGIAADGCETNLNTSATNCGACGNVCTSGVCSASSCLYSPIGPQTNVPVSALSGWTQCYSDAYNNIMSTSTVSATCTKARLLLACRPTGSSTLQLLAQAPRADVMFETGSGIGSSTVHPANGANWYFDPAFSWGFLPANDSVSLNNCDAASFDSSSRLCWDTTGLNGGYRCGSSTGLSGSTAFERLVFQAD